MNERERTALAEAIEHCAMHNREYKHVTPEEKLAEWRGVLEDAVVAAQLDTAVTQGERDASGQPESPAVARAREALRYRSRYDAPPGILAGVVCGSGIDEAKLAGQLRAGDHGYKLGAHRARIIDALLTDIDRAREQHQEDRVERLAQAVATLAGAPL